MAKRSFSFMLDDELRAGAERLAAADDRTLGSWVANLIAREVASATGAARVKVQPRRARAAK